MPVSKHGARSLFYCSTCLSRVQTARASFQAPIRSLSNSASSYQNVQKTSTSPSSDQSAPLDPKLVHTRSQERRLIRDLKQYPIGSRRRRVALSISPGLPFEQLPYQCFQEARNILAENRQEKVNEIEVQRGRIARLVEQDPSVSGGEAAKQIRLTSMRAQLEKLKIMADINDPLVKKKFEDGLGDMNKPIYRYLADEKWRGYKRTVVMQRITQMRVIPDVLPTVDPVASVELSFAGYNVQPGTFVESRRSQRPPTLQVQVFDSGPRLVTVVIVDSDVPNVEKDGFDYRCHGIYANIEISPTSGDIALRRLTPSQTEVLPWLPPHAHKGAPYHRLSVFVLQQPEGKRVDLESVKSVKRDHFILRSFIDTNALKPVGVTMFRTQWDDTMAAVMDRHGIPGADIAFKRKKVEPLPYKKKDGARYR